MPTEAGYSAVTPTISYDRANASGHPRASQITRQGQAPFCYLFFPFVCGYGHIHEARQSYLYYFYNTPCLLNFGFEGLCPDYGTLWSHMYQKREFNSFEWTFWSGCLIWKEFWIRFGDLILILNFRSVLIGVSGTDANKAFLIQNWSHFDPRSDLDSNKHFILDAKLINFSFKHQTLIPVWFVLPLENLPIQKPRLQLRLNANRNISKINSVSFNSDWILARVLHWAFPLPMSYTWLRYERLFCRVWRQYS